MQSGKVSNSNVRLHTQRSTMAHQEAQYYSPDDVVLLDRGNGTSALLHLFGGTLLSWKCNGRENLYLSKKSVDTFERKTHIRGGVPLVFPHFGAWEHGPLHGFARVKPWTLVSNHKADNGDIEVVICLEDDEETRTVWNYKFRLEYSFVLQENSLLSKMEIFNKDTRSLDFKFGFHTYFRVTDVRSASVIGLKGLKYLNVYDNMKEETETRHVVTLTEESARMYQDVPAPLNVKSGPSPMRNIELATANFPDTVVWNPWEKAGAKLPDLDENGYKEFICVEAGKVAKLATLAPGEKYSGTQKFTVIE